MMLAPHPVRRVPWQRVKDRRTGCRLWEWYDPGFGKGCSCWDNVKYEGSWRRDDKIGTSPSGIRIEEN